MHTATMTQRFGVPALVAATLHVVLLFGFRPPVPIALGGIVADPPVKLPPMPVELILPPATPPEFTNQPVRPLNKPGPVKPVTDDNSVPFKPDLALTPFAPSVTRLPTTEKTLPQDWGDGSKGLPTIGGPNGRPIFGSGDLDAAPRAKMQPAPDYPFALRQAGIEGSVNIEFDVDASGRVVSARVLNSTNRDFEDAAVRAVLKWRFEPGRRHGKAVPFRMIVPIGFTVTDTAGSAP